MRATTIAFGVGAVIRGALLCYSFLCMSSFGEARRVAGGAEQMSEFLALAWT